MQQFAGRYVLFSGCAAGGRGKPARDATVALAGALHVALWEAPTKGCCGARADRRVDAEARQRTLAPVYEGAREGLNIVCLSPACQRVVALNLPATPQSDVATYPETPGATAIGSGVAPRVPRVRDVAALLAEDYGLARLAQGITNALSPLRVALHSTCHGDHNPPRGTGTLPPGRLAALLARVNPRRHAPAPPVGAPEALVADPALASLSTLTGVDNAGDVSIAGRCAAHPLLRGIAGRAFGGALSAPCLRLAAQAGADVLVTPCFLCFVGLNLYQRGLDRADPGRSVPVLHLSQVLGLAYDVAPQRLDLGHTTVSARRALALFVE